MSLTVVRESERECHVEYKGHSIHITRDHPSHDWYILVISPTGAYEYDGWWRDSKDKPMGAAIKQAITGAAIDEP